MNGPGALDRQSSRSCNASSAVENGSRTRLLAPLEDPLEEGEVDINDAEEEDAAPARYAANPTLPTDEGEIERHRVDHYPFRSWCRFCVSGRGTGQQHTTTASNSTIPIIGMDYFFITSEGVRRRDELKFAADDLGDQLLAEARRKGEVIKCVILRCMATKNVLTHVVPQKGNDEEQYSANLVVEDLKWLGHTRIILKSDNERSIGALRARVARIMKVQEHVVNVQEEAPNTYDSQSNGGVEVGIRLVRGMFRTLKLCLEARLQKYMPINHALTPWLLEHVSMIINSRCRGSDGMTPWQRLKGRNFRQMILGFGENILYKLPSKGPRSQPDGNMGTRWLEGTFLGYSKSSNTYIIATENGVTTARSLYRRPTANRWNHEKVAAIAATPWSIRDKPVPAQLADNAEPTTEPTEPPQPGPMPHAFRIAYQDLVEHGFTRNCLQCEHNELYGKSKPGLSHTNPCRKRLLDALMTTPNGRLRLEAYEQRIDKAIADRGPEHDWQPGGPGSGKAAALGADGSGLVRTSAISRTTTAPAAVETEEVREIATPSVSAEHAEFENDDPSDVPTQYEMSDLEDGDNDAEMGLLDIGCDDQALNLVEQLGIVNRQSRRPLRTEGMPDERDPQLPEKWRPQKRRQKYLVSEIYSPPRITQEIVRSRPARLSPGLALDLTVNDPDDGQPWDFTVPAKKIKARRLIQQTKPMLLIGSPMCTAFSTWQRLNATRTNAEARRRAYQEACMHIEFVTLLYHDQLADGRYFLHEHPQFASSWDLDCIKQLLRIPGVARARGDQCQYGAEAPHGPLKGCPVMKPIGFMSNSVEILKALSRRCTGARATAHGGLTSDETSTAERRNLGTWCSRKEGGKHAPCAGSICKDMAKYPRELCKAVFRGLTNQLRADGRIRQGCFGIQMVDDDPEMHLMACGHGPGYSGRYKDALTGQTLRDDLVAKARKVELDFFESKGVWRKVLRRVSYEKTGRPPISTRWLDVNKADDDEPNIRSRYVARQMKAMDSSGTSYFAPAPPLEAVRIAISFAMTRTGDHQPDWDPKSHRRMQLSFIDVKGAYFNAKIDKDSAPCYVELPPEDPDHATHCGELLRHMYGTRSAADGWQEEYSTMLVRLGFVQGNSSANVFFHKRRGIAVSVHGDDLTACGPADSLNWYEAAVAAEYEISVGPRLGPAPEDDKQARVLNRVITWCEDRIEYEADPRQAERLIDELGLTGASPVVTPGVKLAYKEYTRDTPLGPEMTTPFRGTAARANFLSADRIDMQFAAKEVCRTMSAPTNLGWQAAKRIGRYFVGKPRLVYVYRKQELDAIDVYVDTDWAGCVKTRKSTSGGAIMLGRHCLKHWSSTQPSTALSSGEAEFYGVVRGAGHGLGFRALLKDLGITAKLRLWTDSSAALGICSRQGLGKLRHIDTHTLWVQQAVRSGRFDLKKIKGDENPADLLTKHNQTQDRIEKLVGLYDCYFKGGRAEAAPSLRTGQSDKKTLGKAEKEARMRPIIASIAAAGEPHMPHNCVSPEELYNLYPNLEAVPDIPLHDLVRLEDDALYAAGMEVVQQILDDMASMGRTKRSFAPEATETAVTGLESAAADNITERRFHGYTENNYNGFHVLLAAEE